MVGARHNNDNLCPAQKWKGNYKNKSLLTKCGDKKKRSSIILIQCISNYLYIHNNSMKRLGILRCELVWFSLGNGNFFLLKLITLGLFFQSLKLQYASLPAWPGFFITCAREPNTVFFYIPACWDFDLFICIQISSFLSLHVGDGNLSLILRCSIEAIL